MTESKPVLLPTQINESRDELLGQGMATLFGKPADGGDGDLLSEEPYYLS